MIPHQSIHAELTNLAASQAAISVSGSLPKLTPAQMAALASGLGRKNGIRVVFDNYSTACTDGKTIVLPLTSKESSWIVRGYLDHELGHVRFTDLDLFPKSPPFERSLVNIIEDVRIEKALGDAYPGMATNLSTLVSELLRTKAGVFEVPPGSPPEAVLCGYVGLTLRTLHLKQHMLADLALNARDQFLATFSPELERDLFEIITQIGSVEDTAGVVDMVRQIVALLEKHRDAQDNYDPDSSDDPQQSQPSLDNQESQENPGQSQTSPDNQDDPDNPDNHDNPEQGPDTSDQPDSHEQSQDNSDQPDSNNNDPGSSDQSPEVPDSSESGPDSNNPSSPPDHPLDQEGEKTNADTSVSDRPDQSNLDVDPTDPNSSEQADHPGQDADTEDQAPEDVSLGVSSGNSSPDQSQPQPEKEQTPLQEAITQVLESDLEISDFGSQLRELARDNEYALGNNPHDFQVAVPAPKHLLPSYAYSEQPITASSSVVAKLSAELKALLQAQGLARNTPSSAGNRIARSRLHRIRTGESKLFLRNSTVKQVNTAIHLLVDISGSMAGRRLLTTRDVVFALIKTLAHQRGINLAVTLFPGCYPYNSSPSGDPVYPVAALLSHGQKPASKLLWPLTARGCTPLAESLRYVLSSMVHLSETRKLVILLTDGNPNDDRTAKLALDEAKALGIEVAALGIEGLSNTALFPICEIVDRVEHLPQKAFKLLESLLTQNKE